MKEMEKKRRNRIKPWIGIMAVLGIWFFVCELGVFSEYVLPSPVKVGQTFLKMAFTGEIFTDIYVSFFRVIKGFVIAFVIAFFLGSFRIFVPAAEPFYDAVMQFFRNVPPLSMIPLLILWCGIGETTKTAIIVLASFFIESLCISI